MMDMGSIVGHAETKLIASMEEQYRIVDMNILKADKERLNHLKGRRCGRG